MEEENVGQPLRREDIVGYSLIACLGIAAFSGAYAFHNWSKNVSEERFRGPVQSFEVCAPTKAYGQSLVAEFQVARLQPMTREEVKHLSQAFYTVTARLSPEQIAGRGPQALTQMSAMLLRTGMDIGASIQARPIGFTAGCS